MVRSVREDEAKRRDGRGQRRKMGDLEIGTQIEVPTHSVVAGVEGNA